MARISTRLAKLETTAGSDELSDGASKLLVGLLGRRDALFFPIRTQQGKVNIVQRQRAYLAGTVGISSKADGAGAWKDSHYQRAELVRRGFVTANRSGGQVTSMFLTSKGDAYAKSMVWDCPQVKILNQISRFLFVRLKEFEKQPVSEALLFGVQGDGDPNDWSDYTELMLPLLVAGLVTSNADAYGRIYYRAEGDFPTLTDVEFPGIASKASADVYLSAYHAERRSLSTAEPIDCNEIVIPAPCSGW